MGEIIERNGTKYEYVTYNNRWTIIGHEYIDWKISNFIAQDIGKEFKFIVTYQETLLNIDARICVFQMGQKGTFISFGCVQASAILPTSLSSLVPDSRQYNELTQIQKRRYFAENYIKEGYID